MRYFKYLFILIGCVGRLCAVSPDEALERLKEGNKHFQEDIFRPKDFSFTREMLIGQQDPFAVILTCSDSRVDPGFIFDRNLGDLFVIRLAGNVASITAMESIDYAAVVLKAPLIVVMGHQNCGAVDAIYKHTNPPALMERIASLIAPYVDKKKSLKEAIVANAKGQAMELRNHPVLKELIAKEELKVVWAYYNFKNGRVDFYE